MNTALRRREFLTLGSGAALVALVGCLESDTAEPGYTDWLATEDGGLLVAYADFKIDDGDEREFDPLSVIGPSAADAPGLLPDIDDDGVADPLLTLPLDIGGGTLGMFAFGLAPTGLLEVLDPEETEEFDSDIRELLVVNGTTIVTGEFVVDELDSRLRENPDTFLEVGFEPTDELGEYTLYEPVDVPEELSEPGIVAVTGERLVVDTRREALEQLIETEHGNGTRAIDADETVEWLVDTAGNGHIVIGQVGPMPVEEFTFDDVVATEPEFLPETEDVMASVEFRPDDSEVHASFAMEATELDSETAAYLESELGTEGDDVSVDIDGNRATVSATYDEDTLDIEFAPSEPEELSPEEVEATVPESALEFEYEPPDADSPVELGTVWVELVEEIEADAVRIESVEAGAETELTSHDTGVGIAHDQDKPDDENGTLGPDISVAVQVDPEGDELIVSVVIDNAVGEVTRETVP